MRAPAIAWFVFVAIGGCGVSTSPGTPEVEGVPPDIQEHERVLSATRELEFQRVQIGFSMDQVTEAWKPDHKLRCASGERDGSQVCLLEEASQSDQAKRVPAVFEFDQTGRLIRVERRWMEQDFDARVMVAVDKFGLPQSDTGLSNPLGLPSRARPRIVVWRSHSSLLTARLVLPSGASWSTWRLEQPDTGSEKKPAIETPYERTVQRIVSEQAAMADEL